jgi:hypothetical protein
MTNIVLLLSLRFHTKNTYCLQVAHRTPPGSYTLRESEAAATNVLSARKRSGSDKCFICAKAKRQRQMFYLRESEAAATKRPAGTEINPTLRYYLILLI